MSRAALSGIALTSAFISRTSTIEVSSTTSRSQSSGFASSRRKPPPFGSTSRRRWIVLASKPVASFMRLAARPVGAHSKSFTPFAERMRRMALTMVVLPTPGPPVTTSTFEARAVSTAALLAVGERQAGALLDPGDGLLGIDPRPGKLAVVEG